jgi:hypothetical protein
VQGNPNCSFILQASFSLVSHTMNIKILDLFYFQFGHPSAIAHGDECTAVKANHLQLIRMLVISSHDVDSL